MASIDKRAGGYRVRWRTLGGDARSRQCPDHATAKALKLQIERALALGRDWNPDAPAAPEAPAEKTLREIVDEHVAARELEVSASRAATIAITLEQLIAALEKATGEVIYPRHLSTEALRLLHRYCLEERGQSEGSAFDRVMTAQGEWRLMSEDERWGDLLPPPRRLRMRKPSQTPRPAPTWAQMDLCLSLGARYQRGHDRAHRYRLLLLARGTGLRHSQLEGVAWSDVDLQARTLTLRGELGKTSTERRGRVIPVVPWLAEEMAGWGTRAGTLVPDHVSERSVNTLWRYAGVPEAVWKGRPLHAFRHGIVTNLRAAGVEEGLVKHLVGHAHDSVTGNTYTDWILLEARLRAAVALIPAPAPNNVIRLTRRKRA